MGTRCLLHVDGLNIWVWLIYLHPNTSVSNNMNAN